MRDREGEREIADQGERERKKIAAPKSLVSDMPTTTIHHHHHDLCTVCIESFGSSDQGSEQQVPCDRLLFTGNPSYMLL